jgi:hypothetical protein
MASVGVGALFALDQARAVVEACSIAWSGPNNPDLQAEADNDFGNAGSPFEMETSTVIFSGEDPFDLYLGWNSGQSSHIASCLVSPDDFQEVGTTASYSHLVGSLDTTDLDGTLKIEAFDGEDLNCFGSHSRTVRD